MVVVAILIGRSNSGCLPAVDARFVGPDSTREAVVFHFDCGFGRKGSANVSIQPVGAEPAPAANLFMAMDSSGMNLLRGRSVRPVVEVIWDDPSAVTVRFSAGARIVLQNELVNGVRAKYEERH